MAHPPVARHADADRAGGRGRLGNVMGMDARGWIEAYARELGLEAPGENEVAAILDLAAVAAHASERTAAPIACWLTAQAGRPAGEAIAVARSIAPAAP